MRGIRAIVITMRDIVASRQRGGERVVTADNILLQAEQYVSSNHEECGNHNVTDVHGCRVNRIYARASQAECCYVARRLRQ